MAHEWHILIQGWGDSTSTFTSVLPEANEHQNSENMSEIAAALLDSSSTIHLRWYPQRVSLQSIVQWSSAREVGKYWQQSLQAHGAYYSASEGAKPPEVPCGGAPCCDLLAGWQHPMSCPGRLAPCAAVSPRRPS